MKTVWFSLFFCSGTSLISVPAYSELILDTQQVTLSTQQKQAVRKSLRLTATEEIEQALQVTPSDLELVDGSDRIPAQDILLTLPERPLSANQTQTLDIQINGDDLKTSGAFTGNLLIQYDDNSQILPMTVQVKSPAALPWITLLAGAGLGTMLSLYRAVGLPKDDLLVRVGKLNTQMRGETEATSQRFKAQVEGELIAVETALGNRDWKTAETHLQAAQMVWTRWLSGKPDWILQITYLTDLLNRVTEINKVDETNTYQQAMLFHIRAIQRQIAEQTTPQKLADLVKPAREQLDRYNRGDAWLDRLSVLSQSLEGSQAEQWDSARARLEDELKALDPAKTDAFHAWLDKVKKAEKSLVKAVEQQTETISEAKRSGGFVASKTFIQPVPDVGKRGKQLAPESEARQNLRLFRWVSQGAAIALIAWLGMAELYEKEATFGQTPISDYFGLFAWGFGAEVSRDAIVKALGDLKSPLTQKKQDNS